jgi:ABC-type sulfate/molybdate transport systems ATPase subunit/ABC-type sulfate transport system permease component
VSRRSPLLWLGGILVIYLTVPVVAFAWRVSTSQVTGFTSPGLWPALRTSVESATCSTLIVAATGVPLAYVLARRRGLLFRVVNNLVALPLALPPVMGGILLIYLVGPYTTLGRLFHQRLTESLAGIVLTQVFVSAPFLIISARSAFNAVDRSLEDLAAALGHRPLVRFILVDLAVASAGIRAGLLLTWLRAIGEYGANMIVAYHPYSLPVFAYVQFSDTGIPTTQAPTVLVLAAAAVAVVVFQLRIPRRHPRLPGPGEAAPGPEWPVTPVHFDLDLRAGDFHLAVAFAAATHRLAILGPSGSGKSMTLRSVAGLAGEAAGRVAYAGTDFSAVPVEQRRIGYVPQGQSLLPHLDVTGQVLFGRGADPVLARHWLDVLGLTGLERRYPSQLSGGQRQRVSLAAALARRPDLLLLDEPFSALDAPVRADLRAAVRRLQLDGLSTVLVTHDPVEAAELSDEVVVISDGRILQAGPTEEVFRRPASPEVARLVGFDNVWPAAATAGGVVLGSVRIACDCPVPEGSEVWLAIRAEAVVARPDGPYSGTVLDRSAFGGVISLEGGPPLKVRSAQLLGDRYDVVAVSVIPSGLGTSPVSQSGADRS